MNIKPNIKNKFIDFISIVMMVVALALIASLYWPRAAAATGKNTNRPIAFIGFPLNESREVEFDPDSEAFEDISPRDRLDQLRDWLLLTTVANAGLSAEDASLATFDLPAIRHSYLQPVSRFDYGDLRSLFIGNGTIIALVPASEPKLRSDYLAQVADEHRKNQGEMPREIIVFDYQIDLHDSVAHLTRRPTIDAKSFFTEKEGYYERKITTLSDVKEFLGQIDTVTYANKKADGLRLGGRKLQSGKYLGVTVEDVAALWQSEEQIKASQAEVDSFYSKVNEFKQRWESAGYYTQSDKQRLTEQYEREEAELLAEMQRLKNQGPIAKGSGFSLDPTYDFNGLREFFETSVAPMVLPQYSQDEDADEETKTKISSVREALNNKNIKPLIELLTEISSLDTSKANNLMGGLFTDAYRVPPDQLNLVFLKLLSDSYGFQEARYDGKLKGTNVGMTLFYTDLLAKLWAIGYLNSTPTSQIDDFNSLSCLRVSPVYRKEIEQKSSTRLWFGPQDKGFQVTDGGKSLLLARTATRVYSAGSDPLEPEKESEANIVSVTFLNWWDSHYEEIARFEPQYQRLNEIMKWSLLISWLNKDAENSSISFLKNVDVYNKHWFPEWVKKQPNLTFRAWGDYCSPYLRSYETQRLTQVVFFPPGAKPSEAEAMPLLQSYGYSGGVSLAEKERFANRPSIPSTEQLNPLLRRSDADYASSETTGSAIRNLNGSTHRSNKITDNQIVTTSAPQKGVRMGNQYARLSDDPQIKRELTLSERVLSIETETGDASINNLKITASPNGFRVGCRSRELDRAQTLARHMSRTKDAESVIATSPYVEAYTLLPEPDSFAVKFKDSKTWARIEPGNESSFTGAQAQVADLNDKSRLYNITFLKSNESPFALPNDGYVVIKTGGGGAQMGGGGPPPSSATDPFEGDFDGFFIRGKVNPSTGEHFIAIRELPLEIKNDIGRLAKVILAEKSKSNRLFHFLEEGKYRKAIEAILEDTAVSGNHLRHHLDEGIKACENFLALGKYEEAIEQANTLIATYGSRKELLLLRGLTRLSKRSQDIAVYTKNTLQKSDIRDTDIFLAEINKQLAESSPPGGVVSVDFTTGREVSIGFKSSKVPELTPCSPGEIDRYNDIIIIDTPALSNIDWSVNTLPSIQEAISLNIAELYRVSRLDIGNFRPSHLIPPDVNTTPPPGNGPRLPKGSGVTPPNLRFIYPRGFSSSSICYGNQGENNRDEVMNNRVQQSLGKGHKKVYILIAKNKMQG